MKVKLKSLSIIPAPEVEKIAEEFLNPLTKQANICYVFSTKDSLKWLGKCTKCSEHIKFLTGYDYIISINYIYWSSASLKKKKALIFHELEHIAYKPSKAKDNDTGIWSIRKHDIGEFNSVVARFGEWEDDVKAFTSSLDYYEKEEVDENELVTTKMNILM